MVHYRDDCRHGSFVCIWDSLVCDYDEMLYRLRSLCMREAVYHWGFSENYILGACRPGNTQKAEDSRADLKSCGAAAFRNMVQGTGYSGYHVSECGSLFLCCLSAYHEGG